MTTAALVLAGGAARRLGGVDKPGLLVGGVPLLDRVLAAVPVDAPVVVVGPERATARPVSWVREEPPGSGPLAALAAGLPSVSADRVWLLAADLPFLDRATLAALAAAADGCDGAVQLDDHGREQWLCGVWSAAALRRGLAGIGGPAVAGGRLREVLGRLDAARVPAAARVNPPPWSDCDTPDDLERARRRAAAAEVG